MEQDPRTLVAILGHDDKKQHGGARPGAGRPLEGQERKGKYAFTLTPANREWLKTQVRAGETVSSTLDRLLTELKNSSETAPKNV